MAISLAATTLRLAAMAAMAAVVTAATVATATPASASVRFQSPGECVRTHAAAPSDCATLLRRGWELYISEVPRYPTHRECARRHQVCMVLPVRWTGLEPTSRGVRPRVLYAPPLIGIRAGHVAADSPIEVLVDRQGVPLRPLGTANILPTGLFVPTPAMIERTYLKMFEAPPPDTAATSPSEPSRRREDLNLGPQDVYPAPSALRDRIRRFSRAR